MLRHIYKIVIIIEQSMMYHDGSFCWNVREGGSYIAIVLPAIMLKMLLALTRTMRTNIK